MISRFRLPLVALALAVPGTALAQSAQDFSLQPAPTPTPTSRAQGPVDTESGAVPVRPRVIGTATPTPSPTPAPVPTATSAPAPSPATAAPRPSVTESPTRQPVARPAVQSQSARSAPTSQPATPEPEFPPVQPADGRAPIAAPPPAPEATGPAEPAQIVAPQEEGNAWPWYLGGAALLALLGGAVFVWRRRRENAPPPQIERPLVQSGSAASFPARDAISLQCDVIKLTRSAMFATLKYRLTLINRTDHPLTGVAIGTDLVSAHSAAPMEQQVATEATKLETRHTFARIAPRQNVTVEGTIQLPLSSVQIIRQGRLPLLVPLMRVRVDGAGEGALVKTFVVGQGVPGGGRVQPFRLDEGPQSYQPIAQRELA